MVANIPKISTSKGQVLSYAEVPGGTVANIYIYVYIYICAFQLTYIGLCEFVPIYLNL